MLTGRKYVTRTDFLPKGVLVYVDTCALQWVRPDMDIDDRVKSLERIRGFRNEFRRRGRVSTTPSVLAEIAHSVRHYKAMKDGMVYKKKVAKRDGHNILFTLDNMHEIERFYKAFDGVYKLLKNGMKRYPPKVTVSPEDVRLFVYDDNDDGLSVPDREIVYTALVAGSGHGILSADVPLLKKYRDGSKEFRLPRTFICDAMRGRAYSAGKW